MYLGIIKGLALLFWGLNFSIVSVTGRQPADHINPSIINSHPTDNGLSFGTIADPFSYRMPEINKLWNKISDKGRITPDEIRSGALLAGIFENTDDAKNPIVYKIAPGSGIFESELYPFGIMVTLLATGFMLSRLLTSLKKPIPSERYSNSLSKIDRHMDRKPIIPDLLVNLSEVAGKDVWPGQEWLEDLSNNNVVSEYHKEFLNSSWTVDPIKVAIFQNFRDPDFNIKKLSKILNTSRSTLYRKWGEAGNNISIVKYITKLRIFHAIHLMVNKSFSLLDTAYLSGFNSQSYFTKVFKKELGETPSDFIERHPKVL